MHIYKDKDENPLLYWAKIQEWWRYNDQGVIKNKSVTKNR